MVHSPVVDALAAVTSALPGGGEERPGQVAMAQAVASAIERKRHLVVQAGTGTGKSLAYLLPAIASGQKVVVATATKALQDQLAVKDLPFLAEHLDAPFTFAVLKGRSNYVCRQRVEEVAGGDTGQLALDGLAHRAPKAELKRLAAWASTSPTGDRAELDWEPSPTAWAAVSVTSRECPGAQRCPMGDSCFAERARDTAAEADVIVVNTHLYGLDLESAGVVLPEHHVVVIDEAHQLEDTISATFGLELTAGRFANAARSVQAIVEDRKLVDDVASAGDRLAGVLGEHVGRRLRGELDREVADALINARERLDRVAGALRNIDEEGKSADVATRKHRASKLTGMLMAEIDLVLQPPSTSVRWVEGPEASPALKLAPVDVAEVLQEALWSTRTAILTSATLPALLPVRLGLPDGQFDRADVGSPFDYAHNSLLYCAADLPDPRADGYEAAMLDELAALIDAAGGRTLALFTSFRAMDAAVDHLRTAVALPILSQRELPKPALVKAFTDDPATSLCATMGFWQGIDVPGPSLSLVTLDRLPFPRPDEPLLQAKREKARADAFRLVDLPRAATLLAQGAGRLIRSAADRGVVAVLDPRLARQKAYRWELINALPPMRRTRDRAEVENYLRELRATEPAD